MNNDRSPDVPSPPVTLRLRFAATGADLTVCLIGSKLIADAAWNYSPMLGIFSLVASSSAYFIFPIYSSGRTWGQAWAGIRVEDVSGNFPGRVRLLLRTCAGIMLIPLWPINTVLSNERSLADILCGTRTVGTTFGGWSRAMSLAAAWVFVGLGFRALLRTSDALEQATALTFDEIRNSAEKGRP